jgi:hypothetical protein
MKYRHVRRKAEIKEVTTEADLVRNLHTTQVSEGQLIAVPCMLQDNVTADWGQNDISMPRRFLPTASELWDGSMPVSVHLIHRPTTGSDRSLGYRHLVQTLQLE